MLRVQLHSSNSNAFDFGLVGFGERRSILFTVENRNPVAIHLRKLRPPSVGISSGIRSKLQIVRSTARAERQLSNLNSWTEGEDYQLAASSHTVFNYSLIVEKELEYGTILLEDSVDKFSIETDFDEFDFPVQFHTSRNRTLLGVAESFRFSDAFIGTRQEQTLKVYNFREEDLRVERMSIRDADPRFYFRKSEATDPQLIIKGGGKVTSLGEVLFVPEAGECENIETYTKNPNCYVGIPLNSTGE